MMIRKLYVWPLALFALFFVASCDESEEPSKYDNWQARNEAFIDSLEQALSLSNNGDLAALTYKRDKRYKIYYKKIVHLDAGEKPFATSTVSCYYRGMYIDEAVFAANPNEKYYTKLYKDLTVFDNNTMKYDDDPTDLDWPASFSIQSFYTGGGVPAWADILENMKVGERWEVYIPWQIAYGESGYGSVPGYSTLMFDIILNRIEKK